MYGVQFRDAVDYWRQRNAGRFYRLRFLIDGGRRYARRCLMLMRNFTVPFRIVLRLWLMMGRRLFCNRSVRIVGGCFVHNVRFRGMMGSSVASFRSWMLMREGKMMLCWWNLLRIRSGDGVRIVGFMSLSPRVACTWNAGTCLHYYRYISVSYQGFVLYLYCTVCVFVSVLRSFVWCVQFLKWSYNAEDYV